jgi:hypothetical protein
VIALGVAIALVGLLFVLYVRRRRSRDGARGESGPGGAKGTGSATGGKEAW